MGVIELLALLVVILAAMWYVRRFRRAGTAFYWPWLDPRRGDRMQQTYLAEEEIERGAREPRDRDLAP
jgi:hypothetical protein